MKTAGALQPQTDRQALVRPMSRVVAVTGVLLCVPLVAMQFTHEVNWTAGDFMAAAVLLLSAGTAIVVGTRRAASALGKTLVVTAVLSVFALTWVHLAVGLFP